MSSCSNYAAAADRSEYSQPGPAGSLLNTDQTAEVHSIIQSYIVTAGQITDNSSQQAATAKFGSQPFSHSSAVCCTYLELGVLF